MPSYSTSVNCSKSKNKVPKMLAMRTHRCAKCGRLIDRDYNASQNIKQKGLQLLLPVGCREVTSAEILGESQKQELDSQTYSEVVRSVPV
uniref:zinc ribbon domain-containing protein n=1 Tax=Candidatus Nitrososphaera gargensis TaxID=497727 RepID=UPI0011E57E77|nr:zinc ribbon domain-containing protein [Candidatus Nitrososphaera gargensis]